MWTARLTRRRQLNAALVLIFALYSALAIGRALTTIPWNDESWYATPSESLIRYGHTGTRYLETEGHFWKGIDRITYWVVPVQFFIQVPWFKLFGFSLLSDRLHSIFWGGVTMLAWYVIVHRLTKHRSMAITSVLFMACDYQFVSQSALGRMDALSAAFISIGVAAYLTLRERNLTWAVLASHACVVACGLTHPTPGVPGLIAVCFLALYLDRSRLRWNHFAVAAVPYILGAAGWAWYISQAPDLFRAQFFGNVVDLDRLGGYKNPPLALLRELKRHIDMGGLAPGMSPLYRLKVIILLCYALSIAGFALNGELRRSRGCRTLLYLCLVWFVSMALYDNTKEVKYAVHLVIVYDAVTAVWLVWMWKYGSRRTLSIVIASLFLLFSTGGLLYTILVQRSYQTRYLPAAQFLQQHAARGDLILAGSEFGFALGHSANIVDDSLFGYYSGKKATYAVLGPHYRALLEMYKITKPDLYIYFRDLVVNEYTPVYSQADYDIYRRSSPRECRAFWNSPRAPLLFAPNPVP